MKVRRRSSPVREIDAMAYEGAMVFQDISGLSAGTIRIHAGRSAEEQGGRGHEARKRWRWSEKKGVVDIASAMD
jgi:hypothetical protein